MLRDDTALAVDDAGARIEVPGAMEGWHLVRIDPQASGLLDLPALAAEAGFEGEMRFSDEATMRTFAAILRERGALRAEPNFVGTLAAPLNEHVDVAGDPPTYIDWSTQWWMTADDDPTTPAVDGLGIGVAKAFEYLRYVGLTEGTWQPARVALIDAGFDLDPETGLGTPDYGPTATIEPPLQIDLVDYDQRAGGPNPDPDPSRQWHGEQVLGVAAAWPRNGFGGAGTGGEYVRPLVINVALTTSDWAAAVRTAALSHAAAINLSLGSTCWFLCDELDLVTGSHLQEEIVTATALGAIVVTSAGNGPDNATMDYDMDDGDRQAPCEMENVLCVGAIDASGDNVWNHGRAVDLWAPTSILSTVTPFSADLGPTADADDVGVDELHRFGGTSCASPFVAGVIGMLKAVDPELRWDDALDLLQRTGRSGGGSDGIATRWLDAFRAVRTLQGGPGPVVGWSSHADGARVGWGSTGFAFTVADGAAGFDFTGELTLRSDVQGRLCAFEGTGGFHECRGSLRMLGTHVLTAEATNEFGLVGRASIEVEVVNEAPVLMIVSPADGSESFTSQDVVLRAQVTDLDGERFDVACAAVAEDEACAEWSSSLDGVLVPPGSPLDFVADLSEGTHVLTFRARDGAGVMAEATVTHTVVRGAGVPNVRIRTRHLARPDAMGFFPLRGVASDAEDGDLVGASLEWSSNVDGVLGTGEALDVRLSGPPREGIVEHTVTLTATDADGNVGTDTVLLHVVRVE
ncbi:MAG: S8/S53 family peptidase [Myxococcota bacterium]